MTKIIMGIGMPGAGKTTLLKRFADRHGYAYICPDDIRKEMCGDAMDQSKNTEVWERAHGLVKEAIGDQKTIVFDATFANIDQRRKFVEFAHQNGASKVQGVFVDVDIETAKERNRNRERVLPEYVFERMYDNLQRFYPDLLNDGFDSLFILDENQELIEATKRKENGEARKEFNVR
jgi:predicted kinase